MYTWMQPGISLISSFGPSTTPWRWWRVECHWRPWAIHVFLLFYGRFWNVDGVVERWVRSMFFFCEFCDMFFHVVWICLWFIVFWNRTDPVLNWDAILKTLLFQLHVGPPWLKDLPILWKSSSEEKKGEHMRKSHEHWGWYCNMAAKICGLNFNMTQYGDILFYVPNVSLLKLMEGKRFPHLDSVDLSVTPISGPNFFNTVITCFIPCRAVYIWRLVWQAVAGDWPAWESPASKIGHDGQQVRQIQSYINRWSIYKCIEQY